MASRKSIWDTLDRLEGKVVGSSHKELNKERVRQGYKAEAKSKALATKSGEKKSMKYWSTVNRHNAAEKLVKRSH